VKLPFGERACVSPSKATDYLLSRTHPVGRGKARTFLAVGFNETNPSELEEALLSLAHTEDVSGVERSVHGTKYVIDGEIETPSGRRLSVRTVWIIEPGTQVPRLVTAYAAEAGQEET
jgi:hypothetical protein